MKLFKGIFISAIMLLLTACIHNNAVFDNSYEVAGNNWSYINKIKVPVKIEDNKEPYSIFINLRHTGDYKYSNIFLLVHQIGSDGKRTTERKEFKLANPDGEWLGSGSGNILSYQLTYKENFRFPRPGTYTFEIEQNMRDNPLREIIDVGLRIEKATK